MIKCQVCGVEKSTNNVFYQKLVCISCRSFFVRIVSEQFFSSLVCVNNNSKCIINKDNRRKACKSCRFDKCLLAGLDPHSISVPYIKKKLDGIKQNDTQHHKISLLSNIRKTDTITDKTCYSTSVDKTDQKYNTNRSNEHNDVHADNDSECQQTLDNQGQASDLKDLYCKSSINEMEDVVTKNNTTYQLSKCVREKNSILAAVLQKCSSLDKLQVIETNPLYKSGSHLNAQQVVENQNDSLYHRESLRLGTEMKPDTPTIFNDIYINEKLSMCHKDGRIENCVSLNHTNNKFNLSEESKDAANNAQNNNNHNVNLGASISHNKSKSNSSILGEKLAQILRSELQRINLEKNIRKEQTDGSIMLPTSPKLKYPESSEETEDSNPVFRYIGRADMPSYPNNRNSNTIDQLTKQCPSTNIIDLSFQTTNFLEPLNTNEVKVTSQGVGKNALCTILNVGHFCNAIRGKIICSLYRQI